jgi:hypothetical protein
VVAGRDLDGCRRPGGVIADPYELLLALAEREHALVRAGSWEDLAAVDAVRRDLVAALPARPPAAARAALTRTAELQAQTSALLDAGADELRRELGTLAQGRVAVRGYGAAGMGAGAASAATRVDLAG